MDAGEIKKLVKMMRENGVLKFKTADVELELSPMSLFPTKDKKEELAQGPVKTPQQSAIESLGWSAPGAEPFTEEEAKDMAELSRQ